MKLPEIWAKCEGCPPEMSAHSSNEVAWYHDTEKWLCLKCAVDEEICAIETGEFVGVFAYASDALPDQEEQMQRLVAAATRRRMGVKL